MCYNNVSKVAILGTGMVALIHCLFKIQYLHRLAMSTGQVLLCPNTRHLSLSP